MIAAAILQVADWLRDPATGLNALLASVPKDVAQPVPPQVTVVDAVSQSWVLRGRLDRKRLESGPLVVVTSLGITPSDALSEDAAGGIEVPVAIRYAASADGESDQLATVGLAARQTLRAAHRVIAAKFDDAVQVPYTRMGVRLSAPNGPGGTMTYSDLFEESQDAIVAGALLVTLTAHDPWSLGID